MRPKLKPDVFWVPSENAVSFVHSGDLFSVSGKSAMPLMDRLAPYLDGQTELDDLVAGLPPEKAEMVTTLVRALADAGLVKDAVTDEPHDLDEDELERYAAEIAYIDHFHSSAARRFQTYRDTPVVVIGSGLTLPALVHAILWSGSRELSVFTTDECETDLDRLAEYCDRATERDPQAVIRAVEPLGDLAIAVAAGKLVLHISDLPQPDRARDLDRLCGLADLPIVQGFVAGDEAWTFARPDATHPGFESAWLRATANRPSPLTGSPFLAGPTAGMLANRVAFTAFRMLTGVIDHAAAERVTLMDLETLHTTEHRGHRHPATLPAAPPTELEFTARMSALLEGERLEEERFSAAAAVCFDHRLGLFSTVDEHELPQLPLWTAQVTLSDPFGRAGRAPLVRGAGESLAQSRRDAALAAFALYGALTADPRVVADGKVYALDLGAGLPELINVSLAHPLIDTSLTHRPVGLAAGLDMDEALTSALLDVCLSLTVPPPDCPELGPEIGGRHRELLGLSGLVVRLHDVTGPLGVPAVAATTVGMPLGMAAGNSTASAAATALSRALLAAQLADVPEEPDLVGPPPAPHLPAEQLGTDRAPERDLGEGWRPLVAALNAHGHRVYALPAGHDPAADAVLPYVVQVVTVHD
ncbi:hypothetical protein AB0395_12225 [Streptosporangium sp. NPDC051023]|uniref:hypothetical protein n=1 Tax=Streptosporangium sp. NPDC051023 TaxID=3155410 RepID=UPI00344C4622